MAEKSFERVRVTIIDGVGCGEETGRRAQYPKDIGVNSLTGASMAKELVAPALQSMGLEEVPGLEGLLVGARIGKQRVKGAFGALRPTFAGNGSPEGHQALMGHIVTDPYLLFDETGFSEEVLELTRSTIAAVLGRPVEIVRYPGTDDINGVRFINHPGIGDRHLQSKDAEGPLVIPVYASSDSLIQIALHQGVVPQELIEAIGKAVRAAVNRERLRIARIIMRPFVGGPTPGTFKRVSEDRRDYGVDPDETTLIDYLAEAGVPVYGLGKAASMLNYKGFDPKNVRKLGTDEERMQAIVETMEQDTGPRFDLDNMVGTDELFGHPREPEKYIRHLEMIDGYVGRGIRVMKKNDLWLLTADHGNAPTQSRHTNHTNERVPILAFSPRMNRPIELGVRESFADVAKTVAEIFGIADKVRHGRSFLQELLAA